MCDILDNTFDIVERDINFGRVYLKEIRGSVMNLKDGDEYVYRRVFNMNINAKCLLKTLIEEDLKRKEEE